MQLIQQLINGLMLGGILAFVAVAFTLTIGMLNFLNFTIPALFMVAAMFAWASSTTGAHAMSLGLHWSVAVALGVLAAILASLIIERFTYRYMKTRYGDATEHALPLVSSLGFLIVFEHLAHTLWGGDPQRFDLGFRNTDLQFAGLVIGLSQLTALVLAVGGGVLGRGERAQARVELSLGAGGIAKSAPHEQVGDEARHTQLGADF